MRHGRLERTRRWDVSRDEGNGRLSGVVQMSSYSVYLVAILHCANRDNGCQATFQGPVTPEPPEDFMATWGSSMSSRQIRNDRIDAIMAAPSDAADAAAAKAGWREGMCPVCQQADHDAVAFREHALKKAAATAKGGAT